MPFFPSSAKGRFVAAGAVGAVGLSLTGAGVYAALTAQASNTSAEAVSSGVLSLTMSAVTGSVGFGQPISLLAPGDVVNRYVDLNNDGTLAAQNLTLAASDTVNSRLTTDATNGLQVTIKSCAAGWVVATGTCTTPTTLATTTLVALKAAPVSLISGALATGVQHLQIAVQLPDITETTVNGVKPANSIQGLTANLTWTFSEAQRTATTTNS